MNSKLLLDSQPLVILPELAAAVGLNEAIVLQQVHYWCELNAKAKRNYRDGYYWVYNSFTEWQKQFPWWCEKTVKTTFSKLEKRNLLITANYNRLSLDRTKWYRVNHEALDVLTDFPSGKNYPMDQVDITRPIPETNPENNNGKKEKGVLSGYPLDHPATKPSSISIPIVEISNEEVSGFIDWYFRLYEDTYGVEHPNIKSKQRVRVTETLAAFIDENGLDADALKEIAYAFFDNVDCDHNINLFATPGMLENRYYESCY